MVNAIYVIPSGFIVSLPFRLAPYLRVAIVIVNTRYVWYWPCRYTYYWILIKWMIDRVSISYMIYLPSGSKHITLFASIRGLRDCVRTLVGVIPEFVDIAVSWKHSFWDRMLSLCSFLDGCTLSIFIHLKLWFWSLSAIVVQALLGLYLLFSSWLAYVLFEDTVQGNLVFTTYTTTLYQMSILFTTSNNPDVWLPAYK